MTIRAFTQQDFIDLESTSSGIDIFASADGLTLAKDRTAFVQNCEIVLSRHLTSKGLVNSWALEDNNPNCVVNFGKSQTIDNSLAALHFYVSGQTSKAQTIFQYYLLNLPSTFTIGQSQIPDWVSIINNTTGETQALSTAYLLYAVCYYQSQTKSTQYRQLALFCAQQLIDLQSSTTSLVRDNYDTQRCSMEANVIAYLGLKLLNPFTNNSDIITFTDTLRSQIALVLGLKDNTLETIFTANSVDFAGIYSLNIGNKFILDSSKTFLQNQFYVTDSSRIIGIGENNHFQFKETLVG